MGKNNCRLTVGYSQGLHSELAPHGIAVTTVCPGLMRTGSARQAQFKGDVDQEYAWFKLSSSLPILTASAESAARQIVAACQRGDAELVISWPAKLAVFLNALSPELAAQAFSLVSRILPSANGPNEEATFGKELEPTMPLLTRLTDQAAKRNNEVEPNEIR